MEERTCGLGNAGPEQALDQSASVRVRHWSCADAGEERSVEFEHNT